MRSYIFIVNKFIFSQRKDIEDIKDSFPMMREYCIFVPMTEVQESMYELYLKKNPLLENVRFTSKLFEDRHTLAAIWTHPRVVQQRYMKRRNELVKKIEKLSKKQMIVDQEDEDKARLQLFTDLGNYEEKNALVMELVDKMEDLLTDIIYSNKFVVMLEILKKCWEKNEKW